VTTYAIPTDLGRAWNARAALGQAVSPITHMAVGDGDRTPTGPEIALLHETLRVPIAASGQSADGLAVFFDGRLGPNVGPLLVREAGLYTAAGELVAVARRDDPLPIQPADDITYRIEVIYSRLDAIAVTVDPVHTVTGERRIDTDGLTGLAGGGDLSINRTHGLDWSMLRAVSAGELAALADAASLNLRNPLGNGARQYAISLLQLAQAIGVRLFASVAEALAGVRSDRAVTPAGLRAARTLRAPQIYGAPGAYTHAITGYAAYIEGVAAGAGGASGAAGTPGGGGPGGGGGAQGRRTIDTQPGDTLEITIPSGGAGGTQAAAPSAGGALTVVHKRAGGALLTLTLAGGQAPANAAAGVAGNSAAGGAPGAGWDQGYSGEPSASGIVPSGGPALGGRGGSASRVTVGGYGGLAGSGNGNAGLGAGAGGGGGGGAAGSYATGGAGAPGALGVWE